MARRRWALAGRRRWAVAGRRRWAVAGLAIVIVGAVVAAVVLGVGRGGAGADPPQEARQAADHFLTTYVQPDGRVVRADQDGDTVSEGQAYGMLIAAGIGDEARFRAVWDWTREHLQRPDHLLAWRWDDGAVVDATPAADADLVAAGALALAGQRFGDRQFIASARQLGDAVLAGETVTVGSWQVLLAGPWAAAERVVNPSYFAVGLMSLQYDATGDQRWQPVAATARRLLDEMTATAPSLVPDWAAVAADGSGVTARPPPSGGDVTSGFEAGRAYVQLAVDCDARGPAIVARAWPFWRAEAQGTINAAYRLDGSPATTATHPLAVVAAAAAADAAGDDATADELLDRASDLDRRTPTYYGAAWVAIGRLWLDTPDLGGCRRWESLAG
jgi:endo-1,4-beta-D-glucanase Y